MHPRRRARSPRVQSPEEEVLQRGREGDGGGARVGCTKIGKIKGCGDEEGGEGATEEGWREKGGHKQNGINGRVDSHKGRTSKDSRR